MDIYRFFHPHHNPRLHSTPLRQQELSELEQAASELRKALERSQRRSVRKPAGPILPAHFNDLIRAMRFVEHSLQTLCDAHEGDSHETLMKLIHERSSLSGWESWTSLVKEQLDLNGQTSIQTEPPYSPDTQQSSDNRSKAVQHSVFIPQTSSQHSQDLDNSEQSPFDNNLTGTLS